MSVKTTDTLVQRIGDRFKQALQESSDFRGDLSVVIEPGALLDLARYLKEDEGFDYFLYATAVDWPARNPRFTLVWEVRSLANKTSILIKTTATMPDPHAPARTPSGPPPTCTDRKPWNSSAIRLNALPHRRP